MVLQDRFIADLLSKPPTGDHRQRVVSRSDATSPHGLIPTGMSPQFSGRQRHSLASGRTTDQCSHRRGHWFDPSIVYPQRPWSQIHEEHRPALSSRLGKIEQTSNEHRSWRGQRVGGRAGVVIIRVVALISRDRQLPERVEDAVAHPRSGRRFRCRLIARQQRILCQRPGRGVGGNAPTSIIVFPRFSRSESVLGLPLFLHSA